KNKICFSVVSVNRGDLQSVTTKYVCPEGFHLVGRKCYHFGTNEVTWHDSHFFCITLNSTLAIVDSQKEMTLLRHYLNKTITDLGKYERWIGGIYDWKQMRWKWGSSGQPISYNKFSRMQKGDKFKWNCIVLNPAKENRWSARKCTDKRHYVCETETNTYIQFKLFNKKIRKKFDIAKCSMPELLPKNDKRKCLKLLGPVENNEPAYIVERPRPTKSTALDPDGFVCPPHMVVLGNRCYTFSKSPATWTDAYFNCNKNNSKLAIVSSRSQDYNLRIFLNNFIEKHDRWIGGMYDWKNNQWKWAMTGKPLKYKGFAKAVLKKRGGENLAWNTIFMDPSLGHRWNADKGTQKKHYICQVKAKAVKKLGLVNLKSPQATITIVTK
ncbi:hypothetical protein NQ315_015626, partial [Exocentrus adspersus]